MSLIKSLRSGRMFAAPEILNQVRASAEYRPRAEVNLNKDGDGNTTETISQFVAEYGLLVDSYSMGHTIRYMMTGVQPGISVEDAMLLQRGGLLALCCGNKSDKQKRSVQYRNMDVLPGEVLRLVGALTQISEKNRLSIRKARWNYPWIADVLNSQTEQEQAPNHPASDQITHLPFASGRTVNTRSSAASGATAVVDASGKTIDPSSNEPT